MTAKITVLEQKTFEGKPSGFKVTLDNGTIGNLQEKESDKGLRVGDEVICTLIPYTSKKGVTSNLLGLRLVTGAVAPPSAPPSAPSVVPPAKPQIHVGTGKSAEDWKIETRIRLWEKLQDGFYDEKIDDARVALEWTKWKGSFDIEINEVFGKK